MAGIQTNRGGELARNRNSIARFGQGSCKIWLQADLTNGSIPSFFPFRIQFVLEVRDFRLQTRNTVQPKVNFFEGESLASGSFPQVPIEHRLNIWALSIPFCSAEPYRDHPLFCGIQIVVEGMSG